ncbi:TIGR02391 family protein [Promicromonospora sp. MEB111]|uniref:TIGR02391 family protein n=1 Tax=Promicromonospora sp. MEB111 TaxID=3040301 RepID=UPI0025513C03|nr:TIGR02391 family protein [Promicromonospora sp. MEB111]
MVETSGETDWQWSREVLVKWLNTARLASSMNSNALAPPGEHLDALWERQAQATSILRRLNGNDADVILLEPRVGGRHQLVSVAQGIRTIQAAIGKIDTMAETAARLGTDAPRMPADAMHPVVWGAASRLWRDGHYSAAVQRAATFINAEIQDKVGRHDVSDAALIRETLTPTRPPEVGKPRLRWPGKDDNLTVKAMREGIFSFALGCFLAIRNPTTHGANDLPRQEALEQLATLSTLARWIDGCDVVTVPGVD